MSAWGFPTTLPGAGVANADLGHLGSLSTLQWVGIGAATGGVLVAILALPWVAPRVIARGLIEVRPAKDSSLSHEAHSATAPVVQ